MSDHIYEARQLALWAEYRDLNGRVSFDAFMERHPRVNAYVVNLLKKFDTVSAEIDCPVSRSDYFGANPDNGRRSLAVTEYATGNQ